MKMMQIDFKFKIILFFSAMAVGGILFFILYNTGINISSDSVYYISVARSISAGNGFTGYDGYALVLQPPLYPFLLTIVKIITSDNYLISATFINAILTGGIVYLSGLLLIKYLHSYIFAAAGLILILTSSILIKYDLSALSEPLFIFLTLLYFYFIEAYLRKKDICSLILLSVIVALACLTRYIGVVVIAAGIINIFLNERRISKRKFSHLIIFTVVSSLPVLSWILRNYIISGSFFGSRAPSTFTFMQNISFLYKTITNWFSPPEYYNGYLISIGLIIAAFFIFYNYRGKRNRTDLAGKRNPGSLIIFILIYVVTLTVTSSVFAYDKIEDRLLSPIYIPVIVILITSFYRILMNESSSIKFNIIRVLIAVGFFSCMNFTLHKSYFLLNDFESKSGWEYNSKSWRENTVVKFIERMDNRNYPLYSNAPDAVYFFTKSESKWSPMKTYYNSPVMLGQGLSLSELKKKNKKYLIWFNNVNRKFLYTREEIKNMVPFKKIVRLADGEVYEID